MVIRLVLVVTIIFNNYVYLCGAESILLHTMEEKLQYLLKPFEDLPSLPKNNNFTEDEMLKMKQEYLEGLTNEDVHLNGTQLIKKYGYDVEEHQVITSDGYYLTLYRIPCKGECKGVVFLMHGILCSFEDWLTAGPDQSLAYLLAASGYDVWLGNARGNKFSKKHITLSTSDPKFWDFSWDEIGRFDLPAMIDYVLETTNKENLIYIGHSQGTTVFFVLCSERPEYKKKISFMVALSAVAWMKHVTSPFLQVIAPLTPLIAPIGKELGLNDFLPGNAITRAVSRTFCGNSFLASTICFSVTFLFSGFDYLQINFKQSPVQLNHYPSGSSLKQLKHFAQLIVSGYFRKYDYGTAQNLINYQSFNPPDYPVEEITVPTAIFYSYGDWLANPIDVNVIRNKLPNVVEYYQIPLLTFNHFDFLWAKDVKILVYDRVLQLISVHVNSTSIIK